HVDRALDEIAHHRLDVASDVAHLGELGRLDFDERSTGELGKTASDLGLPHPGRTDEDDVVRRDLFANRLGSALTTPSIAQGDGAGLFRIGLADDVTIELGRDLTRSQVGETSESLLSTRRGHLVRHGTRDRRHVTIWYTSHVVSSTEILVFV